MLNRLMVVPLHDRSTCFKRTWVTSSEAFALLWLILGTMTC